MKLKFIYVLLLSAFALMVLQSRSGGPAANGLGDRTGSPLSSATCSACHSGGSFSPSLAITVRDASSNTVTSYTPGQNYTIEFNVTAGTGTPGGYGMQAVAISPSSGNAQAGTMGAVISSNTQISLFNTRSYIEHLGINASGTFLVNWTAPASGFGTVSIHACGNTVNANGGTSGDQPTSSVLFSLSESVPSSIAYAQSSYCADETDPSPTIVGTSGGTFTATPAGLSINSSSGEIDLSASTPQAYTVSYDDGAGGTFTAAVTVNALDDASFTYPANSACQSATFSSTPTPVITGGTWSSTTGLSINTNTGAIDPGASTAGTYIITYITNGTCPNTETLSFDILAQDDASFTYPANSACASSVLTSSPTPVTTGGTWSSTTGLSINANTGVITPSNSTVGSYIITHTTNGTCPNTETLSFDILAQDVASFPFTDTTVCKNIGANPILAVSGTTSGFYSASPGGVSFVSALTGEVNLANSSLGTYFLSYISNGTCPTTASANLTISVCGGIQTTTIENAYELFPNPNNGIFSIKNNNQAGMVDISIVDVLGKVVYTERSFMEQNGTKTLALEALTTGTYFVQLQQENKQQTFKVIVE
jgi:hypothetical protein